MTRDGTVTLLFLISEQMESLCLFHGNYEAA